MSEKHRYEQKSLSPQRSHTMRACSLAFIVVLLCAYNANSASSADEKARPMFTESGHTTDSLDLIRKRIREKEAVLVDVREKEEWDAGHLRDAAFVPLSSLKSGEIPKEYERLLPQDKPIYLHCRSGGRVLKFAELLMGKGYDIRPIKAGYETLREAGFEKADDKPGR